MPFSLPAQNLSPAVIPLANRSPLTKASPLAGRFFSLVAGRSPLTKEAWPNYR